VLDVARRADAGQYAVAAGVLRRRSDIAGPDWALGLHADQVIVKLVVAPRDAATYRAQ